MAVGIQVEAPCGLLDRGAPAGRDRRGLVRIPLRLRLGGVATSAAVVVFVLVFVLGPVAALVVRAFVAFRLRFLALDGFVLVLEVFVLVLDGFILVVVGFLVVIALEVVEIFLCEVFLVCELFLVREVFRLRVGLPTCPAAVRKPIADAVRHVSHPAWELSRLAQGGQRTELAQLMRLGARHSRRRDEHRSRGERLRSAMAAPFGLGLVLLLSVERRLDCRGNDSIDVNSHLFPLRDAQERAPLFLRLEPDPLPLRPFEDERDFAVVRLRPPLERLPDDFDERLDDAPELLPPLLEPRLRLDERDRPDDFGFGFVEPDFARPPAERRDWLLARCVLRALGRSSCSSSSSCCSSCSSSSSPLSSSESYASSSGSLYSRPSSYDGSCSSTSSPSSMTPRQAPVSFSCISMNAL